MRKEAKTESEEGACHAIYPAVAVIAIIIKTSFGIVLSFRDVSSRVAQPILQDPFFSSSQPHFGAERLVVAVCKAAQISGSTISSHQTCGAQRVATEKAVPRGPNPVIPHGTGNIVKNFRIPFPPLPFEASSISSRRVPCRFPRRMQGHLGDTR